MQLIMDAAWILQRYKKDTHLCIGIVESSRSKRTEYWQNILQGISYLRIGSAFFNAKKERR